MLSRIGTTSLKIAFALSSLALTACGKCPEAPAGASITIVTPARPGAGGPDEMDDIAGIVKGVKPTDARVVIYTHAGDRWWIQPLEDAPLTAITSKLDWTNRIHLGFEYAVLLVHRTYSPPKQPMQLPQVGGCVWALDTAKARN
jgi:hypothetical protein